MHACEVCSTFWSNREGAATCVVLQLPSDLMSMLLSLVAGGLCKQQRAAHILQLRLERINAPLLPLRHTKRRANTRNSVTACMGPHGNMQDCSRMQLACMTNSRVQDNSQYHD